MFLILIFRYHEDRCTKIKRIIRFPTCGLFLFAQAAHIYITQTGLYLLKRKNYLIWKGDPLFMVANFHPHRSLAWSQLPLHPLHFPYPPLHPLPAYRAFILHTDDIDKPDTSIEHTYPGNQEGNNLLLYIHMNLPPLAWQVTNLQRITVHFDFTLRRLCSNFQYLGLSKYAKAVSDPQSLQEINLS